MKLLRKLLIMAAVASAVGISYTLYAIKGMPDTFDLENDDE